MEVGQIIDHLDTKHQNWYVTPPPQQNLLLPPKPSPTTGVVSNSSYSHGHFLKSGKEMYFSFIPYVCECMPAFQKKCIWTELLFNNMSHVECGVCENGLWEECD